MSPLPGTETNKPFKTFYDIPHTTMYMHTAPERCLKMLVIGGIERVYEVGRNFWNGCADLTYNPACLAWKELYAAYLVSPVFKKMAEEALSMLADEAAESYVVNYHTQNRRGVTMDFSSLF